MSGIAEASIYGIRHYGFGEFMVMNSQFPWMVPVFSVALLLVVAIAALPVAMLRRIPVARGLVTLGLLFLAFYGPLAALRGFSRISLILLALGLATHLSRRARWDVTSMAPAARRSIGVIAGLVVAVMAGMMLSTAIGERRAIAALRENTNAPNVVLIVLDTVRAKSLSTYGYARPTTPTLDRMAADGVVFEHAISTAPWTLPAHASLFTGRYPYEHGANWSVPLDRRFPTLAEVLRDRGYATAGFSANTLNVTRVHGLDRGFIHFEDLPASPGRFALSTSIGRLLVGQGSIRHWLQYHEVADRQPAERITSHLLSWLQGRTERPFFVFVNYFDAHDPYLPPEPFASQFGPKRSPAARFWHTGVASWPVDRRTLPQAARQAEINEYDGAIAYVDSQLNRILQFLDERGLTDNTLVIVTSDHGEQLGEHNLFNHGNSLYRPLVHIPLVLRFPGRVASGVRVAQPVSLRSVPRTVLDLLGSPAGQPFPGISLADYWRAAQGTAPPGEPVLTEATKRPFEDEKWYPLVRGNMRAIVADGFQFISSADGTEELYDLANDPEETTNLAQSAAHATTVAELRRVLQSFPPVPTAATTTQ